MTDAEFFVRGEPISPNQLEVPLAQALARTAEQFPFAKLLDTQRREACEILVFEFDIELPQTVTVDIHEHERIAIEISVDPNLPPRICALRKNFPDTLHQNLTYPEAPKELCLFEAAYLDIRERLTPIHLLQRIANWLARAAIAGLHQPDQPLEPLLLSQERIIFDVDVFQASDTQSIYIVYPLSNTPLILRAFRRGQNSPPVPPSEQYLLLPVAAPPWNARLIHHYPRNFGELSKLFEIIELDLYQTVRAFINKLYNTSRLNDLQHHKLILLLELPKQSANNSATQLPEFWAFLMSQSIQQIAIHLGTMAFLEGRLRPLIGASANNTLATIPIVALRPTFSLTPQYARILSGLSEANLDFVAIGAGALGSQIILNLGRQGFGSWTIVDNDRLLPHNFTRHGLTCWIHEGQNKAVAVSVELNNLLNDEGVALAFDGDILYHKENPDNLTDKLRASVLILDFSASRAVTRFIARLGYTAPRLCSFFGAGGRYCALLYEGHNRTVRIDDLEMQFATAIAENNQFAKFYGKANTVRYAASCRDESTQLPQETVAIHAAAVASFIKTVSSTTEPQILMWEWSETAFSLTCHRLPVSDVRITQSHGWTIRASLHALELMQTYRHERLPNETGGVLLGRIDLTDQIIYIASVLPSPPDSDEWPTSYRRGTDGLHKIIEDIAERTGHDLDYLGEWHSHPDGYGDRPSDLDLQAHNWLIKEMGNVGLPGIVAIVAEAIEPNYLIERL